MAVILQVRRDYAENWVAANPILAQGEIALELDPDEPGNGKFKVGDGIHSWNELQYGGFGGVAGPSGTDGATWLSGVAIPSVLLGNNGDYYWRTTNGDVYKKAVGVWSLYGSIVGPQGAQGEKGEVGSSWLSGVGSPSAILGNEGDHYWNTANGQIWLKGQSDWSLITWFSGNIDGGGPSSVYGGLEIIDGGGVS